MMGAYYNEIEPFAAHVLKQLIRDGVIADGDVDTRSIADVRPEDLAGYTQCHFFAGGGLWSVAARLAGWPDDRPLWTGSCPCQPFSVAGKGAGTDDPRHLWPHFFRLISACKPKVVMGEQVAGKAGYGWLDGVRSDLEAEGYACDGVDIPACSINAPHIRQRLYWVAADMADAEGLGRRGRPHDEDEGRREQPFADPCARSGDVANADSSEPGSRRGDAGEMRGVPIEERGAEDSAAVSRRGGGGHACSDMADADDAGRQGRPVYAERPGECSAWSDGVEWRRGADGKTRRVKSGVRLLVDGMPGRVGLLRIGGNAIVAPLAAEVIRAFMDTEYRE